MKKTGKLTKDQLGFSEPQNAPLYQKPPFYYRGLECITVYYETVEQEALALLPEGLELATPPTVSIRFFRAPFTNLGAYDAALVQLRCLWDGKPKGFVCYQIVTTDAAMAAGREIWGYPKKLGHVEFGKENELFTAVVRRPREIRLCTATIRPEQPLSEEEIAALSAQGGPPVCLKVIPSAVEGEGPSLVQLIESAGSIDIKEQWRGPGSFHFDDPSPVDPWYRLAVSRFIGSYYSIYDSVLALGSVLKTY